MIPLSSASGSSPGVTQNRGNALAGKHIRIRHLQKPPLHTRVKQKPGQGARRLDFQPVDLTVVPEKATSHVEKVSVPRLSDMLQLHPRSRPDHGRVATYPTHMVESDPTILGALVVGMIHEAIEDHNAARKSR